MNSRTKGAKSERECREELKYGGYKVFSPQKTSRFGSQDIFGKWDVIAIKGNKLRFIQVKTGDTKGFLKVLKSWAESHPVPNVTWELWVRKDMIKDKRKWVKYLMPVM